MHNITFQELSAIGYSNYILDEQGRLYKTAPSQKQMNIDNINRYYVVDDNGNGKKVALKDLYRQAYSKEYCTDTIQNLPNEEWRYIEETAGKYMVSNCGRIKSLCGYKAKILQPYEKTNGYLVVKINSKNVPIHRLVAFAFCENKYSDQKTEIHHKDRNQQNNNADNLEILSIAEHHKRHSKKENTDNAEILS